MKIKTEKKMRLDELIKYVWENDIENKDFLSNEQLPDGKHVRVHVNPKDVAGDRCAGVSLESGDFVVDDTYTFTVTVEEEGQPKRVNKNKPKPAHSYREG